MRPALGLGMRLLQSLRLVPQLLCEISPVGAHTWVHGAPGGSWAKFAPRGQGADGRGGGHVVARVVHRCPGAVLPAVVGGGAALGGFGQHGAGGRGVIVTGTPGGCRVGVSLGNTENNGSLVFSR